MLTAEEVYYKFYESDAGEKAWGIAEDMGQCGSAVDFVFERMRAWAEAEEIECDRELWGEIYDCIWEGVF